MIEELAGILIPILMKGGGLTDIFRAFSGHGASNDGLQAMMSTNLRNATRAYRMRPSDETLNAGASLFLDNIGVNPLTGLGQGAASLLSSLYGFAPDMIGSLIGVPSPGSFFQGIANGASGISLASGYGATSIFNPYSVMSSHRRAMSIAQKMYSLGTDNGNGYNVEFGHGLNFDEMGMVAQRMLSSRLPYVDENGNTLNPESDRDAEKFKERLNKLGSKFNEAASMLSKVTGSVDEALRFMDQMAGGNFLGGSEAKALSVARQARNIAASIRVSAAMSGMDPKEMYGMIGGMSSGIAKSMGLDPAAVERSPFARMAKAPAAMVAQAYGIWAASHPDASPEEKQQALMGAQFRANSYFGSSGADMASIVAAHKNLFSEKQLKEIERAYRNGTPDIVRPMVEKAVGSERYYAHMNDPAKLMQDRMFGDKETLDMIDMAGMEGGLREAAIYGMQEDLDSTLGSIDSIMQDKTGTSSKSMSSAERDKIAEQKLRELASSAKGGLTKEEAGRMSMDKLEAYLSHRPGIDQTAIFRAKNSAVIGAQLKEISSNTMSAGEEEQAKARMLDEISRSGRNDAEKQALREMVEGPNADLSAAFDRLYDENLYSNKEIRSARSRIFRNKLTGGEARQLKSMLQEQQELQRESASPMERLAAMKKQAEIDATKSAGELLGAMSGKEKGQFGDKDITDAEAFSQFAGKVNQMAKEGKVALGGDDEKLSKSFGEASRNMVADILGDIGNLKAKENDKPNELYGRLVNTVSESMMKYIDDGNSTGEALAKALEKATSAEELKDVMAAIGADKDGRLANGQIDKIIKQARETPDKIGATREKLASGAVSRLQRETSNAMLNYKDMDLVQQLYTSKEAGSLYDIVRSNMYRDDKSRESDFMSRLEEMRAAGLDMVKGDGETLAASKDAGAKAAIDAFLGKNGRTAMDDEWKDSMSKEITRLMDEEGLDATAATKKAMRSAMKSEEDSDKKKVLSRAISANKNRSISKNYLEGIRKNAASEAKKAAEAAPESNVKPGAGDPFADRGLKYAAGATADQNNALMAATASIKRLQFSGLDLPEGVAQAVVALDIANANARQNALRNAIHVGGGSIARETVDSAKGDVDKLRSALQGGEVSKETVDAFLNGGEKGKEAEKALDAALQKSGMDVKYSKALLSSLGESKFKGKSGDVSGLDLLFDEKGKARDSAETIKGVSGEGNDSAWANMVKAANRQDSTGYEVLKAVSDIATKLSDVIGGGALKVIITKDTSGEI